MVSSSPCAKSSSNRSDVDSEPGAAPRGFEAHVGLCSVCGYARRIVSGRGSTFWLCERSKRDPSFRKYPPLPVRTCPGFEPVIGPGTSGP